MRGVREPVLWVRSEDFSVSEHTSARLSEAVTRGACLHIDSASCGGPRSGGSSLRGVRRPSFRSNSSAVCRLVTNPTTRRRPPQRGHFQTSVPNVFACNVAQSSLGARRGFALSGASSSFTDDGAGAADCGSGCSTTGRSLALAAYTCVAAGEVDPCRRHQGHQALHEGVRCQHQHRALLRRVLVAPVGEPLESLLRHRPSRGVPAQPRQALPVVAVRRGVRVQREAQAQRHPPLLLLRPSRVA